MRISTNLPKQVLEQFDKAVRGVHPEQNCRALNSNPGKFAKYVRIIGKRIENQWQNYAMSASTFLEIKDRHNMLSESLRIVCVEKSHEFQFYLLRADT